MILNEENFFVYCMNNYDNPQCHEISEFEEDFKRFQYLRKLFSRYKQCGELKERLILNHIIILYNCFGRKTTEMLFMKLDGFHDSLLPFVEYLNYSHQVITYDGKIINTNGIIRDQYIKNKLKEI